MEDLDLSEGDANHQKANISAIAERSRKLPFVSLALKPSQFRSVTPMRLGHALPISASGNPRSFMS